MQDQPHVRSPAIRKLLVVDDHPMILEVMTAIGRAAFPEAHIDRASGVAEAERLARSAHAPDMVLLDLGLPGCAGIEALIRMRRIVPRSHIVIVSTTEESSVIRAALDAGARGYIPKTCPPNVVSAALRLVAEGGVYVPVVALQEAEDIQSSPSIALTDRQTDVLRLLAQGLANKEIAHVLRISEETVKQHAKAVYLALGISSRLQAAGAAERRGIKLHR